VIRCKIGGFHGGDYEECRLLVYKAQFVPQRKHITSPLHRLDVRFEIFTVVTIKNSVFWYIKLSSYLTGNTLLLHYGAQPVNAV
jgi:hypothetical protein